jgi:hypothetical protein
MNIFFQIIENTPHEIAMGHKIWFKTADGCDAISATANASGFTPLIAIARYFDWDYDMVAQAAAACNEKGKVLIVRTVTPTLILVPATKGRGNTEKIRFDYLDALHQINPKCLNFTHYGFLQGRFPSNEVSVVLDILLGPYIPRSVHMLVIDIDERRSNEFYKLMRPALPMSETGVP